MVPPYVIVIQIVLYFTIPLILLALNLGLKDYPLARIITCGVVTCVITLFWAVVGFLIEKFHKKGDDANLNLEDNFSFGFCKLDNLKFFLHRPKNPLQLIYKGFMGAAFGALTADYFRDSDVAHPIFNFWAYTVLSHLHMPIFTHSLIAETIETDHYTNTRGYNFYYGRY